MLRAILNESVFVQSDDGESAKPTGCSGFLHYFPVLYQRLVRLLDVMNVVYSQIKSVTYALQLRLSDSRWLSINDPKKDSNS